MPSVVQVTSDWPTPLHSISWKYQKQLCKTWTRKYNIFLRPRMFMLVRVYACVFNERINKRNGAARCIMLWQHGQRSREREREREEREENEQMHTLLSTRVHKRCINFRLLAFRRLIETVLFASTIEREQNLHEFYATTRWFSLNSQGHWLQTFSKLFSINVLHLSCNRVRLQICSFAVGVDELNSISQIRKSFGSQNKERRDLLYFQTLQYFRQTTSKKNSDIQNTKYGKC